MLLDVVKLVLCILFRLKIDYKDSVRVVAIFFMWLIISLN